MKYINQFLIVICVTFLGEVLNYFIPLPVPAGIYGLVIMFLLLEFRIVKLEQVKDVASFFLGIMPLLFVPSSVSFMNAFPVLKKYGIQFIIIAFVTTFLVMSGTGHAVQLVIKIRNKKSRDKENGK